MPLDKMYSVIHNVWALNCMIGGTQQPRRVSPVFSFSKVLLQIKSNPVMPILQINYFILWDSMIKESWTLYLRKQYALMVYRATWKHV